MRFLPPMLSGLCYMRHQILQKVTLYFIMKLSKIFHRQISLQEKNKKRRKYKRVMIWP